MKKCIESKSLNIVLGVAVFILSFVAVWLTGGTILLRVNFKPNMATTSIVAVFGVGVGIYFAIKIKHLGFLALLAVATGLIYIASEYQLSQWLSRHP